MFDLSPAKQNESQTHSQVFDPSEAVQTPFLSAAVAYQKSM
jgi:hypothetical protein